MGPSLRMLQLTYTKKIIMLEDLQISAIVVYRIFNDITVDREYEELSKKK